MKGPSILCDVAAVVAAQQTARGQLELEVPTRLHDDPVGGRAEPRGSEEAETRVVVEGREGGVRLRNGVVAEDALIRGRCVREDVGAQHVERLRLTFAGGLIGERGGGDESEQNRGSYPHDFSMLSP